MEYIITHNKLNEHNIIFKLPIKNQNEKYLNFYKILYSNTEFSLKYILLKLDFTRYQIQDELYKHKLILDKSDPFVDRIKDVEATILRAINNNLNKKIVYNLANEIATKPHLYSFSHCPNLEHFYLKISGVWENETSIGLVYKFCYNTSTEKWSNRIC